MSAFRGKADIIQCVAECPLWVISGLFGVPPRMSAFGGKADITIEASTGRSGWFFRDKGGGGRESEPARAGCLSPCEHPDYFLMGLLFRREIYLLATECAGITECAAHGTHRNLSKLLTVFFGHFKSRYYAHRPNTMQD